LVKAACASARVNSAPSARDNAALQIPTQLARTNAAARLPLTFVLFINATSDAAKHPATRLDRDWARISI
jgi:hypothetical protein